MGFLECLLGEDREYSGLMSSEGIMEQNEPLPVCAGPSKWPLFVSFSRVVEADSENKGIWAWKIGGAQGTR